MSAQAVPAHSTRHAAAIAAFFFPLALLPWLNPVSGGAMTPAIPLLVGWVCSALLFAGLPARSMSRSAFWGLGALVLAALLGVVLDLSWQLLAVSLLMIAATSLVGVRLVQQFAAPHGAGAAQEKDRSCTQTGVALIAWSWLLAGLLNAIIGFLQYRQQTAWLGDFVNHAAAGQVYGNLRQRNQFATLMSMALWALWYLWQQGCLQRMARHVCNESRLVTTVSAWLLMLPLSAGMALTLSRTGLVQLVAAGIMLGFWMLRKSQPSSIGVSRAAGLVWLAGVAVAYLLTTYLLHHLYGGVDMLVRLEGKDSRVCIGRTVLWSNVLWLINQKPWLGWGWGELDYAHYMANYPGMRFCSLLDHAHNLPLHLAVELGIPIAVLVCAVFLWWVWRNRPWSEGEPFRQLMWGVLAMIGVHSLFEYPLWYAHFQMAAGLALGVLGAAHRSGRKNREVGKDRASAGVPDAWALWFQRALASFLLAGLVYASFDFVRVTQLYLAPEDRVWPFRERTQEQAERSFLYRNAVEFARVSTTDVTPEKAKQQLAQVQQLMHYSPEPRVIIRLIECLQVLGHQAAADAQAEHFRQVYPDDYARWKRGEEEQ